MTASPSSTPPSDPSSSSSAPANGPQMARTLRLVHAVMIAAVVVIAAAAWVIFPNHQYPPAWLAWGLGAYALVAGLVCWKVAPTTIRPLSPSTAPHALQYRAETALNTTAFMRLAAAESVVLIAFAASFMVPDGSAWSATIGGALSVVLLLAVARPDRAFAEEVERRLDANGARTGLTSALYGENGGGSATDSASAITSY